MSRAVLALDRFVGLVLSLVLVAGGVLTALWGTRRIDRLDAPLALAPARDALGESWWPWAVGGAGVLLVVLGLRWMLAHAPRRGVGRITLPGGGRSGRSLVEAGPVADAAADALAPTLGVRHVRGRIRRERGSLSLRLDTLLDPDADLALVTTAAERVGSQVAHVLGRDDLTCTVTLRVASRTPRRSRVT